MEEPTKKRIHQIEIIVAAVLLLISIASFFPDSGITGFVSIETKKQKLDLSIENSQSYILTTSSKEPFQITSLKLSGEIVGQGTVKAYIDNGQDQRILIYSNIIRKDTGLRSITGMDKITGNVIEADTAQEDSQTDLVIEYLDNIQGELGALSDEESLFIGNFESQCIESCFIEILLKEDIAYQLLFYVEEGTVLKLNEIVYTIKKE